MKNPILISNNFLSQEANKYKMSVVAEVHVNSKANRIGEPRIAKEDTKNNRHKSQGNPSVKYKQIHK